MTQLKQEEAGSCPACETNDIDESVEVFEGVCETCGFVIHEEANSLSLEWKVADETFGRTEDQNWMSECRIRNATEQQLAEAFETLEDFANHLDLSNKVIKETVDIYCDAFRSEVTDGRVTACVVGACLRLASQRTGTPIPMSRITELSNVDEKKLHRSHLALCDELEFELRMLKPSEYVSFLQLELELTDTDREAAEQLVDRVKGKQAFVGKDPAGIAAAGVYLLQEDFTQLNVAEAVGLSTETVRQRINQLREEVYHA